ncbi:SRPBCC family protein [Actinopolymorpha sp. B11F2]|uniref:SRPBCC family protein n=1 Tax=Actinopolymorpha sp. B11F2 TaxID=3160862 RepID=UPI0032E49BD1
MVIVGTREIAAPAERAWSLLVDWERQSEWMPATTVRMLPGPTHGIGTRLEAVTGFGPIHVADPMRVVAWEPPRRCVTLHEGRWLRGTGTFAVEPLGRDRCRVTWREDLDPGPVLGRVPGVPTLLARASQPFFALALRRFGTALAAYPSP